MENLERHHPILLQGLYAPAAGIAVSCHELQDLPLPQGYVLHLAATNQLLTAEAFNGQSFQATLEQLR